MQVRSLTQEDPLEKETATHSSILTWEIPWKSGGLYIVHGAHKRVRLNLAISHQQKKF